MDTTTAAQLDALDEFVCAYDRTGRTPADFWAEFIRRAGDLDARAFEDDASPELRERYCAILANADEAGFACPPELLHEEF